MHYWCAQGPQGSFGCSWPFFMSFHPGIMLFPNKGLTEISDWHATGVARAQCWVDEKRKLPFIWDILHKQFFPFRCKASMFLRCKTSERFARRCDLFSIRQLRREKEREDFLRTVLFFLLIGRCSFWCQKVTCNRERLAVVHSTNCSCRKKS